MTQIEVVLVWLGAANALVLATGGVATLVGKYWPPAKKVADACAILSTDIGQVLGLVKR